MRGLIPKAKSVIPKVKSLAKSILSYPTKFKYSNITILIFYYIFNIFKLNNRYTMVINN